jgi:hypothetical protein
MTTASEWAAIAQRYERAIRMYGTSLVCESLGYPLGGLAKAVAASGGIKPAALGRVTPERRSALLKACRAYLAAGMPDQWRADPSAFRVARVRGCAPGVSVSASSMAGAAVVVPDNVRRTIAPQFVDRRWAPDPGYRGPFSRAGIGRDVQTGEAWA